MKIIIFLRFKIYFLYM